jgi:hypothetical protein
VRSDGDDVFGSRTYAAPDHAGFFSFYFLFSFALFFFTVGYLFRI